MRRFFGGLVVVAASFAGCSGSTTSKGGSAGHPRTAAEVPQAFAQAVCGAVARCCGEQQFDYDTAACVAQLEPDLADELHDYDGLRVVFDPEAAARCIDDYANVVCPTRPTDYDVKYNCDLMFVGQQEVDQPCTDHDECHEVDGNSPYCEDGVCHATPDAPRAKLGDTCNDTCRRSADEYGGCAPLLHEPTDFIVMGSDALVCDTDDGLACWSAAGQDSTCQPVRKIGESCAGNSHACEIDAYCDVEQGVCVPRRTTGPCTPTAFECVAGRTCDPVQLECVPRPKGAGDSCSQNEECGTDRLCSSDGYCRPSLRAAACSMPLNL
jgi:hypothetical protein